MTMSKESRDRFLPSSHHLKSELLPKEKIYELMVLVQEGHKAQQILNERKLNLDSNEHERLEMQYEAGRKAFLEIATNNKGLIVSIAKKYTGTLTREELINAGTVGLYKGVIKFEITTNNEFSTYVFYWIRQEISKAVNNSSRIIRLNERVLANIRLVRDAEDKFLQKNKRMPEVYELAEELGLKPETIRRYKNAHRTGVVMSLNDPVKNDGDGRVLEEIVSGRSFTQQEADRKIIFDELKKAIVLLEEEDPDCRIVIEMRFGLNDHKISSLREIGEALGFSHQWAHKKLNKGINILQKYFKDQESLLDIVYLDSYR